MFESGEGQQHAKRSDSGELDVGAEVDKTYGFQLPEDEPGQVGTMIYMCVNVCVLVDEDKVEMRCQAKADGYAVKKIVFNIFGEGIFREAPMLQCKGLIVR